MLKTITLEKKVALRHKGWILFAAVMTVQILFIGAGYLLSR